MSSTAAHKWSAPPSAACDAGRDFDTLYEAYFDFVWRSLRRLGVPPSLAEDATQDAFVVVHRRLSDLRSDASPKAWLFGIALRVAHDYRRTLRRKGTSSLDAEAAPSKEHSPFDRTAKAQAAQVLERFLGTLDDDKHAVFVLAELEEMSAPEISEALTVNLNTVYSRLRAARERFVTYLKESGGQHG
jgi:RNA polymerase sigma-70 factor (ECF subfamily)